MILFQQRGEFLSATGSRGLDHSLVQEPVRCSGRSFSMDLWTGLCDSPSHEASRFGNGWIPST